MPKSGEKTMPARVTRSLRSRLISCDMTSSKSDLESVLESEAKNGGPSTPKVTRSRRNSQTEATPPAKSSPYVRLRRYTSMSELNPAVVSSPVRRSSRNLRSSLGEAAGPTTIDLNRKSPLNIDIVPEEDEELEIENVSQRVTRSSPKSPGNVSNAKKIITENAEIGTPSGSRRGRPKKIVLQNEKDKKKESEEEFKERSVSIESNEFLLEFSPEKDSSENNSSESANKSISKTNIKDETLLKDDKGGNKTNTRSAEKSPLLIAEGVEDLTKTNRESKRVRKSLNSSLNSTQDQFSPKAEQLKKRNDINDNNKIDKNKKNSESVGDIIGKIVEVDQNKEEKDSEQTPLQAVDSTLDTSLLEVKQENSGDSAKDFLEPNTTEKNLNVDELCTSHVDTLAKTTIKENSLISVSSIEDEQDSLRDGNVIALDLEDDGINKPGRKTNKNTEHRAPILMEDSEMADAKENAKLPEETKVEEISRMTSAIDKSPNDKMEVDENNKVEEKEEHVENIEKENSSNLIEQQFGNLKNETGKKIDDNQIKGVAQNEENTQRNGKENVIADKTKKEICNDKIENINLSDLEMNATQDNLPETLALIDTLPESNQGSGNNPKDKTRTSLLYEEEEIKESTAAPKKALEPETGNQAEIEVLKGETKSETVTKVSNDVNRTKSEKTSLNVYPKTEAVSKSEFVTKIIDTLVEFGEKIQNNVAPENSNSTDNGNKSCVDETAEKSEIMFADESLNETIDENIKRILESPLKDYDDETSDQDLDLNAVKSGNISAKISSNSTILQGTTKTIDVTEKDIASEESAIVTAENSTDEANVNVNEKELNAKATTLGHEKLKGKKRESYVEDGHENTMDKSTGSMKFLADEKESVALSPSNLEKVKAKAKTDCSANVRTEINSTELDITKKTVKKSNLSSSTPIGKSKKQLKTNDSEKSENRPEFSKSWIQTVVGQGSGEATTYIDGLDVEKRNACDSNIIIKKKPKKPMLLISSDESDDDKYNKNSLIDDEAEVVNEEEDSMSSGEREYLEMNEIPVWGESLGSDDTEDDFLDDEENEKDSLDSFIIGDDEENNTVSIDSNEFSSENDDDIDIITPKKNQNTSRKIVQSSDEEREDDFDLENKKKDKSKPLDSTDSENEENEVAEQPNNNEDAAKNLLERETKDVIYAKIEEDGIITRITDIVDGSAEQHVNISESTAKEKSKNSKYVDEDGFKKSNVEPDKNHNGDDENHSVNNKKQSSIHPGSKNSIPNASCSFEYSLADLFYEDDDDICNKESEILKNGTEKQSKTNIHEANAEIESDTEVLEEETNIKKKKIKSNDHEQNDTENTTFTSSIDERKAKQIQKALKKAYELLTTLVDDHAKITKKKEDKKELVGIKTKSLNVPLPKADLHSLPISATKTVRTNRKRKLSAGKNFISNASGVFIEEEIPQLKKKKFIITSKFETRSGTIYEQIATPIGKRIVNNFEESQATPPAIGYKVEQILGPVQKNVSVGHNKYGIKRKLTLQDPSSCLPKPKWMKSKQLLKTTSSHTQSIDQDFIPFTLEKTSTEFRVSTLRPKKNKDTGTQHPSTSTALQFKNKSLYNQRIKRGTAKDLLMRKEKQNVYNKL